MRWLTSVATFNSGNSAHSLQAGLFEQLLNAPPQRFDRPESSSDAREDTYGLDSAVQRDRERSPSSATRISDRDDRRDDHDYDSEDEERSEPTTAATQLAAASALPLPVVPLEAGSPAGEAIANSANAGMNAEASAGDTAVRDADDQPSEHSAAGKPDASKLAESSAESSSSVAIEPHMPQAGASAADTVVSAAQVRAESRASDSGTTASAESAPDESTWPNHRGQVTPGGDVSSASAAGAEVAIDAATAAPTEVPVAVPAEDLSSVTEVEQRSLDVEGVRRTSDRQNAAAEDINRASGQAEDTTARGGKSRDNRREKWFQRDVSPSGAVESKSAHEALDVQSATTAQEFATDAGSLQSGTVAAGTAAGMAADNGEGSTGGASAGQSATGAMLPDTTAAPQPTAATASSMTSDSRLMASESPGSALQGGDRQSAQSSVVDAVETSSGQPSSQRADAKPGLPDAQRPDVLTQAERVRLVQRVSRSFARLGPMGGQISLKLHPPQLGALNVQVRLEGRSMTAKLTTESGAARDAIMESLPVLRTRLAEQGFEISSFQVDVADNPADVSSQDRSPGHSQAGSDELGGRENRQAGQGTDYRRLAVQQRQRGAGYEGVANAAVASAAAWELPRGVDVEA